MLIGTAVSCRNSGRLRHRVSNVPGAPRSAYSNSSQEGRRLGMRERARQLRTGRVELRDASFHQVGIRTASVEVLLATFAHPAFARSHVLHSLHANHSASEPAPTGPSVQRLLVRRDPFRATQQMVGHRPCLWWGLLARTVAVEVLVRRRAESPSPHRHRTECLARALSRSLSLSLSLSNSMPSAQPVPQRCPAAITACPGTSTGSTAARCRAQAGAYYCVSMRQLMNRFPQIEHIQY